MCGFMIWGGVTTKPKTGKGGDSIWGELFEDKFHPNNIHDKRDMLTMANKGSNTNQSQFFIMY